MLAKLSLQVFRPFHRPKTASRTMYSRITDIWWLNIFKINLPFLTNKRINITLVNLCKFIYQIMHFRKMHGRQNLIMHFGPSAFLVYTVQLKLDCCHIIMQSLNRSSKFHLPTDYSAFKCIFIIIISSLRCLLSFSFYISSLFTSI